MTRKNVRIIGTFYIHDMPDAVEPQLESVEGNIWISKCQCGVRHTIRGVPARLCDVVIVPQPHPASRAVLDITEKAGRYDGTLRTRYTVRWEPKGQAVKHPIGRFAIEFSADETTAIVTAGDQFHRYGRYRSALDETSDLSKIIGWHYSRYYSFLPEVVLSGIRDEFRVSILAGNYTLAEANRLASRLLYAAARGAGWHKLTLREQKKIGLEGQWHHDDVYLLMLERSREWSATGCGEYTLAVSRPLSAKISEILEMRKEDKIVYNRT
jgi:hypothetical protein